MAIMVTFGPARQSSGQPVASYDIPARIQYHRSGPDRDGPGGDFNPYTD